MAIAGHLPALIKSGVPEASGYNTGDRTHLELLATLSLNLVLTSLRTAQTALPLTAFCSDGQEPMLCWRRLASLWKAFLAIDDWDYALGSLVLTGGKSPALNYRHASDEKIAHSELTVPIALSHVRQMAEEGRIFSDPDLRGAAAVWNIVRSSLPNFEPAEASELDRLATSTFFRISANRMSETLIKHAFDETSMSDSQTIDLVGLIMAGPSRWSDKMLTRVADYLIERDIAIINVTPMLRFITELDARGSVALARKLLRYIPSDADFSEVGPSGIASIIFLSRRHQVPELLSRCIGSQPLNSQLIDWLSIEDVSWIFESKALPESQLADLFSHVKRDPRFRRALERVQRLATDLFGGT